MSTFPPPAPPCSEHGGTGCMGFITGAGWACQTPPTHVRDEHGIACVCDDCQESDEPTFEDLLARQPYGLDAEPSDDTHPSKIAPVSHHASSQAASTSDEVTS